MAALIMRTLAGVSLVFLILLFAMDHVSSQRRDPTKPIKCYQCNSFYDKGCADFFDNRTYPLLNCPVNATMCRKIVQETYYDGTWDIRYIRQCATQGDVGVDEGRWCKERTGSYRVKVKYCHCDQKDGCNTAMPVKLSHLNTLLPLLALLSLFLYKIV